MSGCDDLTVIRTMGVANARKDLGPVLPGAGSVSGNCR
jgi:hypothetical protein